VNDDDPLNPSHYAELRARWMAEMDRTYNTLARNRAAEDRLYSELFNQETVCIDQPHGWIQWKGTDVCVDLRCACGIASGNDPIGHYDGYDMYAVQCTTCGRVYRVMQNIGLVEATTDEQRQYLLDQWRPKEFDQDDDD
jgi:hypothetical protein